MKERDFSVENVRHLQAVASIANSEQMSKNVKNKDMFGIS
jgi:hypothetical protein